MTSVDLSIPGFEDGIASRVAEVAVTYFKNGGRVSMTGRAEEDQVASMPLSADGEAILSFSLLYANPEDWIFDWSIRMSGISTLPVQLLVSLPIIRCCKISNAFSSTNSKNPGFVFLSWNLSILLSSSCKSSMQEFQALRWRWSRACLNQITPAGFYDHCVDIAFLQASQPMKWRRA